MEMKCIACGNVVEETNNEPTVIPEQFFCINCIDGMEKILSDAEEIHKLISQHIKNLRRWK